MSFPPIHESEMAVARAEHEAGDILGEDGQAFQHRIEAALETDPDYRAWADAKYQERWGRERPHPEPEAEL